MVIPGVSGSMMMLLMGYYNPIVAAIKNFVTALAAFDMAGILEGCGILVPMGLGIVVGIFAIAKVIEIIFEKFPIQAFWAIIGLIVASPIAIFLLGDVGTITVIGILTSIVTFAVGFLVAVKLGD
jgi:putative membrane protein